MSIPFIINQFTSLLLFISFGIVAGIYKYLMKQAPSETSKRIYKYLVIAWLCFTFTYVILFIRNFFPPSWKDAHRWVNKFDTSITSFGITWLFMFLGELYASKKPKRTIQIVGWCTGLIGAFIYSLSPGLEPESTAYGVEVVLSSIAEITALTVILAIMLAFVATILYFQLAVVSKLEKKITLVSITYIIFWIFQLSEAGGLLFWILDSAGFGGLGMVINRVMLILTAFLTIIVWAGKQKFNEAIRRFPRF